MPGLSHLKPPPHSPEAEQSVLGGLLIANDAYDRIADLIRAEDFYGFGHRLIFAAAAELISAGHPADVITVAERLEAGKKLEGIGGLAYLGSLAQNVPTAANIRRYAEIVKDRAMRRALIANGVAIADAGYSLDTPVQQSIDTGITGLEGIEHPGEQEIPDISACLLETIRELEEGHSTKIKTHIAGFDALTGGLAPGDVTVLGARPSMGKTALAMQIAVNVAMRDTPVLVFSFEMSSGQLTRRTLSHLGGVDAHNLRCNSLTKEDYDGMTAAISIMHRKPLYIDDGMYGDVSPMRAKAKTVKRKAGGLGLIVIDYLQLMSGSEGDTRNDRVSEISRGVKLMARELDVPVLLLSQLSRSCEARTDKRPLLADLRDSGSIEQDADIVVFLYREEVYSGEWPGIAEALIRKQRNGPLGTVWLEFDGARSMFKDRPPMQRTKKQVKGYE